MGLFFLSHGCGIILLRQTKLCATITKLVLFPLIYIIMDRGFNLLFQGNRNNFGGQSGPNFRERADQSDRRYDDFYNNANANNMNQQNRFVGNNAGGPIQNHGGNWNNGPNQMGFPNQGGPGQSGMNGPMLNALQQQNLINALMSTQGGKGLLAQNQNQNMGQQNNRQRFQNRFASGTNNRDMNRDRRGARPGDKRKNNSQQSTFNKQGRKQVPPKGKVASTESGSAKEEPEQQKIPEIEIPDDEVIVPESVMESVEKLRNRSEIERNVADEDVEKIKVFSYTGKGYQCKTCGTLTMKDTAFVEHLMNKNHVMKVIDARTAKKYQEVRDILDIDLTSDDWFINSAVARTIVIKQSKVLMRAELELKAREKANFNKTPSNFFNFNMELRKSVVKKDEEVIITSLVESNVAVKDFTGEKFFGCEFVRAVTGFHCRLCSINIREAKGVIPHIDSKLHKTNYAAYTRKNPEYEKTQKEQNQDLFDIMSQHDGKSVVLAESANVEGSQFLSLLDSELVRIPSVMKPDTKKDKKEEKEAEGTKSVDKAKNVDEVKDGDVKEKDDTAEVKVLDVEDDSAEVSEDVDQVTEEAEGTEDVDMAAEESGEEVTENGSVEECTNDDEVDESNTEVPAEPETVKIAPKKGKGRSKASSKQKTDDNIATEEIEED